MKTLFLLISAMGLLWAAPALNIPRQYQQPDGTTFTARMQGDEFLNWIETEDGEILRFNKRKKTFEHIVIHNNRLKLSGETYKPGMRSKVSPLHPRITREDLRKLWEERRAEAARRKMR